MKTKTPPGPRAARFAFLTTLRLSAASSSDMCPSPERSIYHAGLSLRPQAVQFATTLQVLQDARFVVGTDPSSVVLSAKEAGYTVLHRFPVPRWPIWGYSSHDELVLSRTGL